MLDLYHNWKMFLLFDLHKVLRQVQLFFFSFVFVMNTREIILNVNK